MKTCIPLMILLAIGFTSCQKCYDCNYDPGHGANPQNRNFCGEAADVDQEADGLEALGWTCQ